VGETITLDYGAYSLKPMWGWGPRDGGEPTMSDEVVLFLVRPTATNGYAPAAGGFWLAESGLRVIYDGDVYRFEQHMNPGPYEPVPQGRDPFDVLGRPGVSKKRLSLAELEADLAKAITRAKEIREALRHVGDLDGRTRLLDLLGPESDDGALFPVESYGFYEDEAARTILDRVALEKDPVFFLDAVVRAHGRATLFLVRTAFSADELIAEALSTRRTVKERVAAITCIRARGFDKVKDADILALLHDPEAEIRAAAAGIVGSQASRASPRENALIEQFRTETDDRVRYALLVAARDANLLSALPTRDVPQPIVSARRKGDAVVLAWGSFEDRAYRLERLVLKAEGPRGTRTETAVVGVLGIWSSTNVAGTTMLVGFDPPLGAGRYVMGIDCDFVGPNNEHASRHVALEPMVVRTEPAPQVSASTGVVQPGAVPPVAGPPPVAPPRAGSCSCTLSGAEPVDAAHVSFVALLLGFTITRRSARRAAASARRRSHPNPQALR